MTRLFTLLFLLVFAAQTAFAQHPEARQIAFKFVHENAEKLGLLPADVTDLAVSDLYPTAHNGATHVWLQQRHAGIPVYLGLFQVTIKKDGTPVHLAHRWTKDMAHKVNSLDHAVSVSAALKKSLQSIDYQGVEPRAKTNPSKGKFTFGEATFGRDITADLVFQPMKNGRPTLAHQADALRLAWSFQIQVAADHHLWAIRVDAVTGEILKKEDLSASCDFGKKESFDGMTYLEKQACVAEMEAPAAEKSAEKAMNFNGADASYNVWPFPYEAPNDGPRTIVVDPADPVASPFGWHDTNGTAGPEYVTTRGNNVYAYQDSDGNDAPANPSDLPNGGAALTFDAPFNPDDEPENQSASGVINLFYAQNMMHDFAFNYGLDGPGGAFQDNNYGTGGLGNDHINAEARDGQFAANPSVNNANFTPSADGFSGKTQMFVWDRSAAIGGNLKVDAPANVAGTVETTTGFGAPITDVPVSGLVEIVDDGSATPTFGCGTLLNNLTGKIALVDRQTCEFGKKALNAQNAGAIACIICNFEDALIGMGAGAVGGMVTIPVVMIKKNDCDIIRQYAGSGLAVSIVQPLISGPDKIDGDLDNGIIAHEFGHGLSNRLVGGPSIIGCLSNAEQMGEGISDLMTLFVTAKATDTKETSQGIGTYVQREDAATGKGIRSYPYSTLLSTNPLTYGDVALNTEVHAVGEVWTAMVWEVYWDMIELYGFDADLINGTGGNNKAIQLFFDAMKLVPCSPGFADLRDAFFTADELANNGIHRCLISEAFAKRGLGIDAVQGDSDSAGDQVEDFNPIATCIAELKIKKSVDKDLINAGDEITVTIDVINHKPGSVTGVVVKDPLPAGLSYVAGSATNAGNFVGGNMVWNLGTLASGESKKLVYKAVSSNQAQFGSTSQWFDNMENGDGDWEFDVTLDFGGVLWMLQTDLAYSGTTAWYAPEVEGDMNIYLNNIQPRMVSGNRPVMRFWHKYDTEAGSDGGFCEISTNGGVNWSILPKSKYIRRGPGDINYGTFALANLAAWSGTAPTFVDSYIDLSSYIGQSVNVRWRFGCDDQVAVDGWYVDDVEMLDLFKYDSEATITSTEGDNVSAKLPAEGVFVNPTNTVGINDLAAQAVGIRVQPNPASDMLFISLTGNEPTGDSRINLFAADGRLMKSDRFDFRSTTQVVPMDVANLAPGFYILRIEGTTGSGIVKVVIK